MFGRGWLFIGASLLWPACDGSAPGIASRQQALGGNVTADPLHETSEPKPPPGPPTSHVVLPQISPQAAAQYGAKQDLYLKTAEAKLKGPWKALPHADLEDAKAALKEKILGGGKP